MIFGTPPPQVTKDVTYKSIGVVNSISFSLGNKWLGPRAKLREALLRASQDLHVTRYILFPNKDEKYT